MASTVLSTEEVPQALLLLVGWVVGKVVGTSALFSYHWSPSQTLFPLHSWPSSSAYCWTVCTLVATGCLNREWATTDASRSVLKTHRPGGWQNCDVSESSWVQKATRHVPEFCRLSEKYGNVALTLARVDSGDSFSELALSLSLLLCLFISLSLSASVSLSEGGPYIIHRRRGCAIPLSRKRGKVGTEEERALSLYAGWKAISWYCFLVPTCPCPHLVINS